MNLEVYADGSANSDDKPGGYGWVLVQDGIKIKEGNGHMERASNNDAELMGAIHGLSAALQHSMFLGIKTHKITLVSDSQIVLKWADGTYAFKQLNKIDKYEALCKLMELTSAKTRWVKGHSGDVHNERCDKLANAGRLKVDICDIKNQKKSKIGKSIEGIFLFEFNGIKKIVDLIRNKVEDYSTEHAEISELKALKEEKHD
jgi:ribonuclease HI